MNMTYQNPRSSSLIDAHTFKPTDGGRRESRWVLERNDCTVRAVAIACGVSYSEAHDELERRGRQEGKGVQFTKLVKNNPVFCGKVLVPVFDFTENNYKQICLCTAKRKFPKGRFIIRKSGHAFALIDGVDYDSVPNGKYICVKQMWRVKDAASATSEMR